MKNAVITIVCVLLLAVVGCALIDEVVPAKVHKRSSDYAQVEPEVSEGLLGYDSLAGAKRVKTEIVVNHRDTQIALRRAIEDDNLAYKDAEGFIDATIAQGEYLRDLVVGSEDNPFSVLGLIASLGFGGAGVAIGRKYLKRPGDYSPQEFEIEMAKNGNSHS